MEKKIASHWKDPNFLVALASLVIALVSLVISVFALWVSFVTSNYYTWNDRYCFELTYGKSCYAARTHCEREIQTEDPTAVTKQCYKVSD